MISDGLHRGQLDQDARQRRVMQRASVNGNVRAGHRGRHLGRALNEPVTGMSRSSRRVPRGKRHSSRDRSPAGSAAAAKLNSSRSREKKTAASELRVALERRNQLGA